MASLTPAEMADPSTQAIPLLIPLPNGTVETYPVPIPQIDLMYHISITTAITYACQIGASLVMLLVVLGMTPLQRIAQSTTARVNVASLALSVLRCTLLAVWFQSSYMEFYVLFSGTPATADATRLSVVATLCAVLQTALVQWALCIQAWSMVQLWRMRWRMAAVAASLVLVLLALGFKAASSALQIRSVLADTAAPQTDAVWVRKADLICGTANVVWFCALFVARLAYHMWRHRSMLPSARGASAMEVLVMTNGVLMIVPVIFAGLQFDESIWFEPGSLVLTSVVIILPLGTLIAARIATKTTNSGASGAQSGYGSSGNATGKRNLHSSATSRGVTLVSNGSHKGATGTSTRHHVKNKASWSHNSTKSLNPHGGAGGTTAEDDLIYSGSSPTSGSGAWHHHAASAAAAARSALPRRGDSIMLQDVDHDDDDEDLERQIRGGAGIRVKTEFGSTVESRR